MQMKPKFTILTLLLITVIVAMGFALFSATRENAALSSQFEEARAQGNDIRSLESQLQISGSATGLIGKMASSAKHNDFFDFLEKYSIVSIYAETEFDVYQHPHLGIVELTLSTSENHVDFLLARCAQLLYDRSTREPIDIVFHESAAAHVWKIENVSEWDHLGAPVACYRITDNGFESLPRDYGAKLSDPDVDP